ncbi:MAG: dihydroorotase [Thermoplasmata archaeon]|nr:dihydroorotase [Thermoplasmata archaeon]
MVRPEVVVKGKILFGEEIQTVCIGMDEGKITVMGKHLEGDKTLDFSKYLILPGGVDIHTHMRDPGFTYKEDFDTGTEAAAFGGTTTILDMPNTSPPTETPESLKDKLDIVGPKANVDYGLYAALTPHSDIPALKELAIGFKLFMAETTSAPSSDWKKVLSKLMSPELAGEVVSVHAEDLSKFEKVNVPSLSGHDKARNVKAELSAVKEILEVETAARLHIAHVTTPLALEIAEEHSLEATPHHLFLNSSSDLGAFGKVNPPLRRLDYQGSLFSTFIQGRINIIASDHAPHTRDEKSAGFMEAPSGVPGVETRIPLMLGLIKSEQASLGLIQETCCHLPARLFGLRKGRIDVGYDADLAVYDIKQITKINGHDLHSKCGWTPFENFNAIFPSHVMLAGNMIINEGVLVIKNSGKNIGARF